MLQAWVPRQWALHFSVISALALGTAGYWAQSYWGGMLPAAGAALLFGGMRRILQRPRTSAAALFAAGVVILANCRPYEGFLASLPAGFILLRWLVRDRRIPLRDRFARFVAPVAAVLAIGVAWTALHNRAVTGSARQLPYALHQRQYFRQGVFLFSSIRAPERPAHPRIDLLIHRWTHTPLQGLSVFREAGLNVMTRLPRTLSAAFGAPPTRGRTFLGVAVWIPVLLLAPIRSSGLLLLVAVVSLAGELAMWRAAIAYPVLIGFGILALFVAALVATRKRNRSMRFVAATVGTVVLGNAIVWWWFPHYIAPVVPLVIAAAAMAVHRLARVAPDVRPQRLAVNTLVLIVVQLAALAAAAARPPEFARPDGQPTYVDVRRNLLDRGGRHLVFVRYGPDYPGFRGDWVYNEADIRSSAVVFAHDLGSKTNGTLVGAFPDRTRWLLEVSEEAVLLAPCCP